MALLTSDNVLDAMEVDAAEIAARMAEAVLAEVAEHAAVRDRRFAEEVLEHSRRHVLAFVGAARTGRPPSGAQLDFVRERGAQRARELLSLEAVLHSYLIGQRLIWEALVERAGDDSETALGLTALTFEYAAAVNAAVAEGWSAAASEVAAQEERTRRDLLEHLLAGDPAAARRAASLGVDPEHGLVVAVAVDADGPARLSRVASAIARAGGWGETFAVIRHDEVVALFPVDAGDPRHALELAAARPAGGSLRIGVSGPCFRLRDLPRAYEEARRALRHATADRPVMALDRVSLPDELAASADDIALRTISEAVRILDSHADLRATLVAFADHDLNVARTAAHLHVHPNTVQYRLRRIEELTGADPRRFRTALDMLLGLAALERQSRAGTRP